MVSVAHFRSDAENILFEIERRLNEKEEQDVSYFIAATTVQRCFRGYITRVHMQKINEKAIVIQRFWRGFTGRLIYEELLKERYHNLCMLRYNENATLIQRYWKGCRVRSTIFNFYKLKSWLEFIRGQNKNLKLYQEKYRQSQNKCELEQRENEAKEWIIYILFKLHHLLRTHQISGIYSLPRTSELSEIEKMLSSLKYKDFMTFYDSYKADIETKKASRMPPYILQGCKYAAHFEREWHEHNTKHNDPYRDNRIPVDRHTRYESLKVGLKNKASLNIDVCECSFCAKDRSIQC